MTYTNVNRLRTGMGVQTPSGTAWKQTYAYDAMKRLTNVTSGSGSFGYKYGVQASSLPIRVVLPGGSYSTNTYDGNARLLTTQLKNSGNTLLNSHSYVYNLGNQRATVTNFYGNAWDYVYDGAGQLVSAKGRDGATNRLHEQFLYKYDEAGNLQTRTNNALVQSFVVNALNQLSNITRNVTNALTVSGVTETNATSVTVNAQAAARYLDRTFAKDGFTPADGTNTFTAVASNAAVTNSNAITAWLPTNQVFAYDLNGNLLSDGRQALAYDDENQLISVLITNVWKSEFTYDGKMRLRVAKEYTISGGVTNLVLERRYIYDGMLCIQERDGSNVPTITYTRGRDLSGSREGAGGIGGLLALTEHKQTAASVATAYYHCDGNGNVTALVNTNGVVVARYAYDPYGNTLSITGPRSAVNRYRFSSKEQHDRSGFYSFGRRFYVPEWQRWPNQDPIREGRDFNLYTFLANEPVRSIDPDGRIGVGVQVLVVATAIIITASYLYKVSQDANTFQDESKHRDPATTRLTQDDVKRFAESAEDLAALAPKYGVPPSPGVGPEDLLDAILEDAKGVGNGLKVTAGEAKKLLPRLQPLNPFAKRDCPPKPFRAFVGPKGQIIGGAGITPPPGYVPLQ